MLAPANKGLDERVHEFFGRLGESMGMLLVQGTPYGRLFEGVKERNFMDMGFIEKEFSFLADTIAEDDRITREMVVNSGKLKASNQNLVTDLRSIKNSYLTHLDETRFFDETKERIGTYLDEYGRIIEGKIEDRIRKEDDVVKTQINKYFDNLGNFLKIIRVYNKEEGWKKERASRDGGMMLRVLDTLLRQMQEYIDDWGTNVAPSKADYGHITRLQANKKLAVGFAEHAIGYIAAELYMKENHDFMEKAPELFRQPDSFVFGNMMASEKLRPYQDKIWSIMEEKAASMGISLSRSKRDSPE
jgi:hypothetical protein